LLSQDYPGPLEIIVVENGSTDATAEIAQRAGVTVIRDSNRDYSGALIRGFAHAQSDIIALTDADSVVPSNWVSRLIHEYQRDRSAVAIGGGIVFERPNLRGWFLARVLVPLFNWIDSFDPKGPHLWGANFSVRREAFEKIGGWNRNYSLQVDCEISERLRAVGKVRVIRSLQVRTSSRRWNHALLNNLFVYISNFVSMRLFSRPMWRDFQVVRDDPAAPRRRWGIAAFWTLALLAIAGLSAAALSPQSSLFGRTYWRGAGADKLVALSFDDGPNEPCTSQVLDILKRENVKATFFLIGENVRHFPDTAARIVREGHIVGNHTDHHPMPFALRPSTTLQAEVSNAEMSIRNATGQYAHLFRPPNGLRTPWLMSVLDRDSLIAVTWDDAPGDWDPLPVQTIVERTLSRARPGSIILLHDGMNLEHGADQGATVRALPGIIEGLRARGYRFVTVPELLKCPATLSAWPPRASPRRSRA